MPWTEGRAVRSPSPDGGNGRQIAERPIETCATTHAKPVLTAIPTMPSTATSSEARRALRFTSPAGTVSRTVPPWATWITLTRVGPRSLTRSGPASPAVGDLDDLDEPFPVPKRFRAR